MLRFMDLALHFASFICYIRRRRRVRAEGLVIDTQEAVSNVGGSFGGSRVAAGVLAEMPAYRGGWRDGRFGPAGAFGRGRELASWEGVDRVAYYRGFREGLRVRRMLG